MKKRRPYIRRDKLIIELKEIYDMLCDSSKRGPQDVGYIFGLEQLFNLIQTLQGTYKTLEQKLTDIAIRHLNDEPTDKNKGEKKKDDGTGNLN